MNAFHQKSRFRSLRENSCLLIFLVLAIALIAPQLVDAQGQQPTPPPAVCVAPSMSSLIATKDGVIQISDASTNTPNSSGSAENEKGITAAQRSPSENDMRAARRWFEKAARKGYAPAQTNLAVLSIAGWGGAGNAGSALYWLQQAANQDFALAYFDLGILYLRGCGVRQDYPQAFSYFKRAAEAGNAAAQMNLGYMYDQGFGVTRDRDQAAVMYRKAAEAGVAQAEYNLGDSYLRGEGVLRDVHTALVWFQKAAEHGYSGAQVMLGSMYAEGIVVQKDEAAAYMWLWAAELQGDHRGNVKLRALEEHLDAAELLESQAKARTVPRNASAGSLGLSLVH